MDATPGSTIAALCYARDPGLDFHGLATDLTRDMWDSEGEARLDMPMPDLALCDMPDSRIGLSLVALDRAFPGTLTARHYPKCLVLSVGPGETPPSGRMDARHARLRSDLLSHVQDIAAADRVLVFERGAAFDEDMLDTLVDDIRGHLDKVLAPRREPVSDVIRPRHAAQPTLPPLPPRLQAPAEVQACAANATIARTALETRPACAPDTAPTTAPTTTPGPDDIIQGLAARLESELDRLEGARRALEAAEINAERRTPQPQTMRQILPQLFHLKSPAPGKLFHAPDPSKYRTRRRLHAVETDDDSGDSYPDYEHMPANIDDRPLLHRAAVNALNVTVMTIALPVGAALLTMSVLGREDMLFSSRVTAVTGVGVGLYNTGVAQSVFSLFS